MLYAALTFWLLTVVLIAWGVHRLWCGMAKPKVVNAVLLPGTLVAQAGRVFALLITGAPVRTASLYDLEEGDESAGANQSDTKIPVIGPVVVGLLPLLSCGAAIYFVADLLGQHVLANLKTHTVGPTLPTTVPGVWQFLRDQISLTESIVSAIAATDFTDWKTPVFLYLLTCMAVRIAPVGGNLRGVFGAILILGIGGATVGMLFDIGASRVASAWGILNLTVAMLLCLLMVSLIVRGIIGLTKMLRA